MVAGLVIDPGVYWWVTIGTVVGSASVVPGLDVIQDGGFGFAVGSETSVMVELGFKVRKPILGHGVIPADSGASHRLGDTVASAPGLKLGRRELRRGELSPSIRVINRLVRMQISLISGHGQRTDHEVGAHVFGGVPADDHAGAQVNDGG